MYQIILVLALLILNTETAKPLDSEATVLGYKNTNDGLGNYFYSYQTSNGIAGEETGRLIDKGLPDEHISVEGYYTYTDDEGNIKIITYKADKNGFVITPLLKEEQYSSVPGPLIASLLG